MSYTLLKNVKIVKSESGFNFACDAAESNVTDMFNRRIYEHMDRLFRTDYATKDDLRFTLFQFWRSGEIHTSYFNGAKLRRIIYASRELRDFVKRVENLWRAQFEHSYDTPEREQAEALYDSERKSLDRTLFELYYAKAN